MAFQGSISFLLPLPDITQESKKLMVPRDRFKLIHSHYSSVEWQNLVFFIKCVIPVGAQRVLLLKKSAWLLHLNDTKVPPTARDNSEAATLTSETVGSLGI